MDDPIAITPVNIREVWPSESNDFTPWLADHVEILGEHLGIGSSFQPRPPKFPFPAAANWTSLLRTRTERSGLSRTSTAKAIMTTSLVGSPTQSHWNCRSGSSLLRTTGRSLSRSQTNGTGIRRPTERMGFAYFSPSSRHGGSVIRHRDSASDFFQGQTSGRSPHGRVLPRVQPEQSGTKHVNKFWAQLLPVLNERSSLFRNSKARTGPYMDVNSGPFSYQIWVKSESCHVQLRIDSGDADENDGLFEEIEGNRATIEPNSAMPCGGIGLTATAPA